MFGDEVIIRSSNLLVKLQVGTAAQAAALGVLVKDTADEERIISDVRPQKKGLRRCAAREGDEHVGEILMRRLVRRVRSPKQIGPRKRFQNRSDVIAKFTIGDAGLLENVPGQDVKIKLRRDLKMSGVRKNRVDQPRMIENRIARFRIAQEIDKRNVVARRTRESAHDKIEIHSR